MYFTVVHGVQQIAAEAARASIAGITETERISLAQTSVDVNASSYPFIARSRLSVTSATTDPATSTFTITLVYDASDLPIFTFPMVPMPSPIITKTSAIQKGGF